MAQPNHDFERDIKAFWVVLSEIASYLPRALLIVVILVIVFLLRVHLTSASEIYLPSGGSQIMVPTGPRPSTICLPSGSAWVCQ